MSRKVCELNDLIRENTKTNNTNINDIITKFVDIILDAANQSIPKTTGATQKRNTPWWNTECQKAIKEAKKLLTNIKKEKLQRT